MRLLECLQVQMKRYRVSWLTPCLPSLLHSADISSGVNRRVVIQTLVCLLSSGVSLMRLGFLRCLCLVLASALCSRVYPCSPASAGDVSLEFSTDGASMDADDLGNSCLGVAGRNERFNLVPLLQGELIILLCHVVITKVVFRLHPPGASFRFGYASASLRPRRVLSLLHLSIELTED